MWSRFYRTRTEIRADILQMAREWGYLAEKAAKKRHYPEALRCIEAVKRWERELEPTPRSPRSLADGGFNTDGVSSR